MASRDDFNALPTAGRDRQMRSDAGVKRVKKVSVKGLNYDEMDVELGPSGEQKFDWQRPMPIKIGVGKQNLRVNITGWESALGMTAEQAFGELAKDLKLFTDQLEEFMPNDLGLALEPTFELSLEYCPIKTGELRESGYLAVEGFRGGARAEIGYGKGGNPAYTIAVHELDYKHEPPTQSHWLLVAMNEDFFNIQTRIVENLKIRVGA